MKPHNSQPVAPVDAVWLHMDDPTNLMMVTAVLWVEGQLGPDELRALVLERVVGPYPHFRQRIVEPPFFTSSPLWVEEPALRIEHHIDVEPLPPPGDEQALQDRVSVLLGTPLDRTRPLWHLHLVPDAPLPGSDADGPRGTAIVCRLHHCMADGMALAQVLLGLTDESPGARGWSPAPHKVRDPHPFARLMDTVWRATHAVRDGGSRVLHRGQELLEDRGRLRRALHLAADSTVELGHLLALPADHPTRLRGPLGVHKRATWTRPVALERIKAIGRAHEATVNDVLVAAMTGALRHWLALESEEVPEIRVFIPVNLRPPEEPVPVDLGNRFSLVFLGLPVGEADRTARLHEVKRRMDALKASTEPAVAFGILQAMGRSPEAVEHVAVEIFGTKASAVLTNVPGPPEPIHLAGRPVAGIQFWVPQAGRVGLGVSIFSYAGAVSVGLASDSQRMPDPETLARAFETELSALATEAGLGRV